MQLDRRGFLNLTLGSAAAGAWLGWGPAHAAPGAPIKAVAFDAFTIFDPRPIAGLAESLFAGRGAELSLLWRTRQFEYQWLRTLSGRYADFLQITEDALVFAARTLRLDLTSDKRAQLMHASRSLSIWPDVLPAVSALKQSGLRLTILSNMTAQMLEAGCRSAGLEDTFEHILSADRVNAHKPDPRAYRMAPDAFQLGHEEILFAAFAGWDAAGAKWFGFPCFWVNRLDLPSEELGVAPDGVGRDLEALVQFAKARR